LGFAFVNYRRCREYFSSETMAKFNTKVMKLCIRVIRIKLEVPGNYVFLKFKFPDIQLLAAAAEKRA